MRTGWQRMSRKAWYAEGGFANPHLTRKMRGKAWTYWKY